MNILHVIRDISPTTGGPVSAIRGLTNAQRHRGHDIHIAATDYGLPKDYVALDGEIICKCTFAAWRYSPSLGKKLNEEVQWANIVHIHTMWEYPTVVAARVAKKANKPLLIRPCGMLDSWSMNQSAFKKKLYLRIFSKDLLSPAITLHFTTQAEKSKSIYPQQLDSVIVENGIVEKTFSEDNSAEDFLECYPQLRGKDIILFLGRVHPKKQPEIAVSAFSKIASKFPNASLVMAGPCEPAYQTELINIANDMSKKRVLFTGMLQGKKLYGAYRAAKVFVLPSFQENFGIAVAEAMANYCPVIISEHVDIKNYIQKGNAGIVCAAKVESFASAISSTLSSPQSSTTMGNNGRKVSEQYFRWDIAAKRLDAVYQTIISNQKSGI